MSYRMQHGGGSQVLAEFDQKRRLAYFGRRADKIIEAYNRTGSLPRNVPSELLSHIAERMSSVPASSKKKRRRRRKTANRHKPLRVVTSATPVESVGGSARHATVWSSSNGGMTPSDLKFYFGRYSWDAVITCHSSQPIAADCIDRLVQPIDNRCSIFPIWYKGEDGSPTMVVLFASSPEASRSSTLCDVIAAIRKVCGDERDPHVESADSNVLEALRRSLLVRRFECVASYIRKCHRKCSNSAPTAAPK